MAHHPFDAEFDWKRPVTINGTVTKFEWKEPHSVVEIKGKDEKGTEGQWTVELGGMTELNRNGWNRNQLKAGEQVRVDGWMSKDGSKKVSAKSITPSNGREMFAASSFFDMGASKGTGESSANDRQGTRTPAAAVTLPAAMRGRATTWSGRDTLILPPSPFPFSYSDSLRALGDCH